jgi:hypothetical protein
MSRSFSAPGFLQSPEVHGIQRPQRLPEKSYKRECQETSLSVGSVPILFCLGIQPNWLNVHSPSESGLAQA